MKITFTGMSAVLVFFGAAVVRGIEPPTEVAFTKVMSRLKDQLHWEMKETRRGARITVMADNKPALDAVHEFLRFQIEDHQTGDCPMVR